MEQKLLLKNNQFITYKVIDNKSDKDYIIVYLHGFCGDMDGKKGTVIENIASENKIDLIKLNYLGHGTSSGKYSDFTMDDWFENITTIIDKFSNNKKMLFIGSSMGGWFCYIMALKYGMRTKGIVSFSTAIDFLTEVIEPYIKDENKNKDVVFAIPNSDNIITRKLLLSSKKFNLMDKDVISIHCPIRMIHGLQDTLIPYMNSVKFVNKLASDDVELKLVKTMDHRLSLNGNLDILKNTVLDFINKY